jgi:hypothetical protein
MAASFKKRFLTRHAKSSALLASLLLHALLVFTGLSVVVVTVIEKKDQAFVVHAVARPKKQPAPRKLQVPVVMRNTQPPNPKMQKPAVLNREVKTVEARLSDMIMDMGGSDYLDSGGGLDGLDLGLNIDFFGIIGGGTHIVFILDCSLSMWGEKDRIMRSEASRIIRELPRGTHFAVIFFGGPAWPAGREPDLDDWVSTGGGWQSFRPKDWSKLPKVKYKKISADSKSRMIREIHAAPLIYGTVYDCPIYMALSMDPVPDTVFFMTDGESSAERGIVSLRKMVDQLTEAGKRVPVMHTVGFGISHDDQLVEMAALMRGEYRFLTASEYISTYGRDRSRPFRRNSGMNVEENVESVSDEQYPVEFSLQ